MPSLSIYIAPRGLPQDPGHAPKSLAEAKTQRFGGLRSATAHMPWPLPAEARRGLMLAGELALAGIDVAIVERRASQELIGSRAGGLHCRTIEVLDQRGIADRFLASGQVAQVAGFAQIRLDISDFPTRHPYGLALWQNHIERILAGWVDELGVPIYREREVAGCRPGRHRGRRSPVRRPAITGAVPGRLRRRAQRGPEIGGHRVPRLGARR